MRTTYRLEISSCLPEHAYMWSSIDYGLRRSQWSQSWTIHYSSRDSDNAGFKMGKVQEPLKPLYLIWLLVHAIGHAAMSSKLYLAKPARIILTQIYAFLCCNRTFILMSRHTMHFFNFGIVYLLEVLVTWNAHEALPGDSSSYLCQKSLMVD